MGYANSGKKREESQMFRNFIVVLSTCAILSFSALVSATHYYESRAGMSYMRSVCLVIDDYSMRRYGLSEWEQDGWYQALQKVSSLYNGVFYNSSKVNFAAGGQGYSPSWCTSIVVYSFKPMSSSVAGKGEQPRNGLAPSRNIYINSNNFTRKGFYSTNLKAGLLAHELGHNLGLCHTGEGHCRKISWTSRDHEANKSLFRANNDPNGGERVLSPIMTSMDRRVLRAMYR